MNRKQAFLFAFSATLLVAGCGGHSGADDGAAMTPPPPPPPGPAAPPPEVDLAAFARVGITDAEYGQPRTVNDVTFVTSEQEAELDDWF
jgi:hypothetical protein